MEILLQNGAEVNAVDKVKRDDWRDMNEGMHVRVLEMKGKSVGTALAMAQCIEPLFMDKVDEISWHQFAHPRIWDRMRLMMNIA